MAEEQSKYTGVLATLRRRTTDDQSTELPSTSEVAQPAKGRGRPPGKRSDPDFQPTTVLIRKHTKRTATRLLEDTNAAQDLSDLIEQLLTQWIQQHS